MEVFGGREGVKRIWVKGLRENGLGGIVRESLEMGILAFLAKNGLLGVKKAP